MSDPIWPLRRMTEARFGVDLIVGHNRGSSVVCSKNLPLAMTSAPMGSIPGFGQEETSRHSATEKWCLRGHSGIRECWPASIFALWRALAR